MTRAASLARLLNASNQLTVADIVPTGNTVLGDAGSDTITFNANTLSTPNNLNIDSGLMFIDASNNRVGIGTTTPGQTLDVNGNMVMRSALFGYGDVNAGFGIGSGDAAINIGASRSANGFSYIDIIGDTFYTDFGLRIIRGNNGANAASQLVHRGIGNFDFLATEAATIRLSTTNTERLRITSDGNIGIGTTTPSAGYKLDVVGQIAMSEDTATKLSWARSGKYLNWIECDGVAGNNYMRFATGNSEAVRISANGTFSVGTTVGNSRVTVQGNSTIQMFDGTGANQSDFDFPSAQIFRVRSYHASGSAISFGTNASGAGNSERMRITADGRVGIGTTSPAAPLVISNAGAHGLEFSVNNVSAGTGGTLIESYNRTGAVYTPIRAIASLWRFDVNSGEVVRITSDGNVGIGTSSPGSRLDVVKQGNASGGTLLLSGSKTNNAVKYGYLAGTQYASDAETEGVALIGLTATDTLNMVCIGGGIDEMNTSTDIRFYTASSTSQRGSANERFRFGPAGQLGIAGANYGTSGQVLTSGGSGAAPTWGSGGKVLQVISTQITSVVTVSTPSTLTYYDIPSFTITITPTSSSSKILILAMVSVASSSTSGDRTYIRLLRDSTPIAIGDQLSSLLRTSAGFWNNDGTNMVNQNIQWLDSPSTTSAITYKFQCATNVNGGTSIFNRSRDTNLSQHQTQATQILAFEIAA